MELAAEKMEIVVTAKAEIKYLGAWIDLKMVEIRDNMSTKQ